MSDLPVTDLFRALDLTGVFANAMLGGVIARRENWTRSDSRCSPSCPGWAAG